MGHNPKVVFLPGDKVTHSHHPGTFEVLKFEFIRGVELVTLRDCWMDGCDESMKNGGDGCGGWGAGPFALAREE